MAVTLSSKESSRVPGVGCGVLPSLVPGGLSFFVSPTSRLPPLFLFTELYKYSPEYIQHLVDNPILL